MLPKSEVLKAAFELLCFSRDISKGGFSPIPLVFERERHEILNPECSR